MMDRGTNDGANQRTIPFTLHIPFQTVKKLKLAFWRKTEVIACSTSRLNPHRILHYLPFLAHLFVLYPASMSQDPKRMVLRWINGTTSQISSAGILGAVNYQCPYQIELDRRSCPKGCYNQLWEDRFEECKDGSNDEGYPGVEINVSEAVVDLVWYLPGVVERFGMYIQLVRRLLFISTDLIKSDQKVH